MSDTVCPNQKCRSDAIMHRWRTDMHLLKIVDDYKCLKCGTSWNDEVTYRQLMDLQRDDRRRWA